MILSAIECVCVHVVKCIDECVRVPMCLRVFVVVFASLIRGLRVRDPLGST